jgi:hypothetical protein
MKPPVLPTKKKPELIPMFTTLVPEKPTKIVVMMVMFPNVPSKSTLNQSLSVILYLDSQKLTPKKTHTNQEALLIVNLNSKIHPSENS